MAANQRILLVDDAGDSHGSYGPALRRAFPEAEVLWIADPDSLARALAAGDFSLVVTEYRLSWTDGLAVLRAVKARWPDRPVIMLTAAGSEDVAVEGMKAGLADYVRKSDDCLPRLFGAVRAALATARSSAPSAEAGGGGGATPPAVERQAGQLAALLQRLGQAAVVADRTGRMVAGNEAAREISGMGDEELSRLLVEGRPRVLRPDRTPLPAEEWPIRRALRGEETTARELIYLRPDGTERHLLVSATPLRDESGQVALGVAAFRDETDALQRERGREEFIAAISHSLQSPLTLVYGYAQILRSAMLGVPLAGQQRQSVEMILASARRMTATIQSLVDSARLAEGCFPLRVRPVDPTRVALEVAGRLGHAGAGQRSRVVVSGSAPSRALADPDRLAQILTNLVENALEYSPPDAEVTVTVSEGAGEVVVSVADEGEGVPPEDVARIFDRHYRGRRARERREGLGLGLYIARRLVEAHGGRIWLETPAVGAGSTFCFTIPIAPDGPARS